MISSPNLVGNEYLDELYQEDDVEKLLRETDIQREPREYVSMLMVKDSGVKQRHSISQRLDTSHVVNPYIEKHEFLDEMRQSIKKVLDGKRGSTYNY